MIPMDLKLRLRNRWEYEGDDKWKWVAFVDDGGSGDLKKIDHVKYFLHPTFPKPVREVTQRDGGFPIATTGWGTFELLAYAHTLDGQDVKLSHELQLEYEPKAGESA
jgi:transcription initiation factor IIF auxiliary subunit